MITSLDADTTPLTSSSGNVAAATATATLAAAVEKLTYNLAVPAGVTAGVSLMVEFTEPIPASAQDVAIVVNVPSLGAGNTNSAVVAHGFQAPVN